MTRTLRALSAAVLATLSSVGYAADYVMTAPPRESAEKAREVFQPIAEFLSKTLGQSVEFKYSDNWLSYQSDMQSDKFDFVFDGPHFVGWRMAKYSHTPIVALPGELSFAIVTRKDEKMITSLEKVAGRMVCAPAPPNLGTLSAAALFTNPVRQPLFINTKGFPQAFEGLLAKKCAVAVIQVPVYNKLDKDREKTQPITITKAVPNQAISASARVPASKIELLRSALLGEAGKAATKKLREEYAGKDFIPAKTDQYKELAGLLKDTWGFELQASEKIASR